MDSDDSLCDLGIEIDDVKNLQKRTTEGIATDSRIAKIARHWESNVAKKHSQFHVDFVETDIGAQIDTLLKNKNRVTYKFHTNDHTFDVEVGLYKKKFGILKKSMLKEREDDIDQDKKVAAVTPNNKFKNKSSDGSSDTGRIKPGRKLITQSSDESSEESSNNERRRDNFYGSPIATLPVGAISQSPEATGDTETKDDDKDDNQNDSGMQTKHRKYI